MESTVARLLDKVALLGDVGGYVCFTVMATAASVVVELGEEEREGGSGGLEWCRGALGRHQASLGGSGRAGGGRGDVDVLKQLGGIPPSSLGARGGRRQGEEAGWARWANA